MRSASRCASSRSARSALPGSSGTPVADRDLARTVLQAEVADLRRGRADEDDAGRGAGFGERGILAQEAVARMDRLGAGCSRRLDERLLVEVALRDAALPDRDRLVRLAHVRRIAVGLRVHGDRGDSPSGAACE